ncbi:probable protein flp at N-terminal half [Coccomyxa sp. Obi]|nr:probable protein flp at N-terminal half [Coccomyxa sp. Obi]
MWVALTLFQVSLANVEDEAVNFLTEMTESRVIGGTVAIQKAGELVWSKGFGVASEELGVPLQDYHIFPIGSNTKFFTAAAIYQLQEKGLLNISDAVNGYIDPADFGLDGPWCPKIHGQEQLGCQEPTIKQLLQMSSGLPSADNIGCGYPNFTTNPDWLEPYMLDGVNLTYGEATGDTGNWLNGKATAGDLLRFQGVMHLPMLSAPGAQYCYVNANFNLAGYVVERLTNMSFTTYLEEFILRPANLSNTYYWIGGQGMEPQGTRKNVISIPGYLTTFANQSNSGTPVFQKINRAQGSPFDLSIFAGAAGAMFSDIFGLLKWYNVLMTQPEVIGLSKQSVASMTQPLEPLPIDGADASFAQGVLVRQLANAKLLSYTGGIWGFYTTIDYWVNPSDPGKSDAVLFFSNVSPIIPSDSDGTCSVQSARDGSIISLEPSACDPSGADMTRLVIRRLAQMWNITGNYSSI